ncbi:MAG TPA: xanthine dehydrogenase family protein molybdopterin-binding subunit [Alphaproteobacteria bacterium]
MVSKFGIGQSVPRTEDPRFLTGRGRYVDDIQLPNMSHGVVVRSPHAHARIKSIDTAAAMKVPGVIAVLTAAEMKADKVGMIGIPTPFMPEDGGGPKSNHRPSRPVLADGEVRHVGDRVAFVVAETQAQARDAAELVNVDYEPLPAVVSVAAAIKPGAPAVWDKAPNNVCVTLMMGDKAATDAGFAKAKHTAKVRLVNNRLSANSMEPRGALGYYDRSLDQYTLYTSNQAPHGVRQFLAMAVFMQPETKFRVIAPDVGGGFGMKGACYPEDVLTVWASKRIGRPVKWFSDRVESFLSDDHGRDQLIEFELALDGDGKFLGLRANQWTNVGAYLTNAAPIPTLYGAMMLPGVYVFPAVHLTAHAVFSHTGPVAPYRGAGRPEATYNLERLVDEAARVSGIDRFELRRRNFIPSSAMPYVTKTGLPYDSGEYGIVLEKALKLADYSGFGARKADSQKRGKIRGFGLGYYTEICGVFNDRMEIRFDPSGTVTVVAGTHSHGQGHETVYAQMVSEWLGVPFETIRVLYGDTAIASFGRGTYGSRSMTVGGSALKIAADTIIAKAKKIAAMKLEAAETDIEFADGTFTVAGTDKKVGLVDLAKFSYAPVGFPTKEFGIGLEASGAFAAEPPNFPNGAHVAEVEIDPDTGEVKVDRYCAVDDVGNVMNPMLMEGQIHGGVGQGLGQALLENINYDADSGQLVSGSFMDYCMPRANDLPMIEVGHHPVPCKTNPLGVKGAGEAGSVGAPPAIVNAILDALKDRGIRHIDMPVTPERLWQTMKGGKAA